MQTFPGLKAQLESLLISGKIGPAIVLVQSWLAVAGPYDVESLLDAMRPDIQPKLALLLRDLISSYPTMLVGCPVLLYIKPEDAQSVSVTLPGPRETLAQPNTQMSFVGWLGIDHLSSTPIKLKSTRGQMDVPTNQVQVAIAIFETQENFFDQKEFDIPFFWWANLFQPIDGLVRVSARMAMPYPDAYEAARIMLCSANEKMAPRVNHFLSDEGATWAMNEGLVFKETCESQFKPDL